MFALFLAFVVGVGLTLLAFSLRPPRALRHLAAFWVPIPDSTLRSYAAAALAGAFLLGVGFYEGQRYMALPPADMRAVAASFDRATAANVLLMQSVTEFSTEVDRMRGLALPVARPLIVRGTDP